MKKHLRSLIIVIAVLLPTLAEAVSLPNPLQGANIQTAKDLYIVIIRQFLAVIGLVSLLFFLWGGFRLVMSAGNPEVVKKAKDTLLWALLGMVIALLSYTIVQFVFEAVSTPAPATP